jgi:hypothetical protein
VVRSQAFREATKKCSPRLLAQLEAVPGALEVLPFETPADATYGLLRARGLSKLAHESAPMICSSRLKHSLLVTRSSPITKKNSSTSRTFDERMGHAKPIVFRLVKDHASGLRVLRARAAARILSCLLTQM